jgi:hypothetical protein
MRKGLFGLTLACMHRMINLWRWEGGVILVSSPACYLPAPLAKERIQSYE